PRHHQQARRPALPSHRLRGWARAHRRAIGHRASADLCTPAQADEGAEYAGAAGRAHVGFDLHRRSLQVAERGDCPVRAYAARKPSQGPAPSVPYARVLDREPTQRSIEWVAGLAKLRWATLRFPPLLRNSRRSPAGFALTNPKSAPDSDGSPARTRRRLVRGFPAPSATGGSPDGAARARHAR